jgi:outer membrane protein TolC
LRLAIPADANVELDQNELLALKDIGVEQQEFAINEAIETALLRRLDLANTADRIDDRLRIVVLAQEGLGPQIDLRGQTNFTSSPANNSLRDLRFTDGTYAFGFDVDLPLDRKTQRNNYRASLISLEQQKRRYAEDIDSVKFQVRDAFRRLQQTAEQFRIQQNSLNLATQRVESNKLLLDAGRVTVRILLESQDALLSAQNDLTSALIDHLDAKLSFYRDVGILQVKPDGMWAQADKQSGKPKNEREPEDQPKDENL